MATYGTRDTTVEQPTDGPELNAIRATNASIKEAVESDIEASNLVDITLSGDGDALASIGSITLPSGMERRSVKVTHGADTAGTVTVTVKGTPYVVNVEAGDSVIAVAKKIADALSENVENYKVIASNNVVILTSTIPGNVEDLPIALK